MQRIFISFTHDTDIHKDRVYALADRLRGDGVNVIVDRDCLPGGPDESWQRWSEELAENADIILMVFNESYRKCWDGDQPTGIRRGATFETPIIRNRIYDAGAKIDFCRVVLMNDDNKQYIPQRIEGHRHFLFDQDYADLLAWLREKGAVATPAPVTPVVSEIHWPSSLPDMPRQLADRGDEFSLFTSIVRGEEPRRILLLEGRSNSGKTALMTELFAVVRNIGLAHALLDIKGCPSITSLLDLIESDIDPAILPECPPGNATSRHIQLLNKLQCLQAPLILGFDTYQEASTEVQDWIERQLLSRTMKCPGLVIVISGQTIPDQSRFPWNACASTRQLQPITNVDDWLNYISSVQGGQHLKHEHCEALVLNYAGDPGQISASLKTVAKRLVPA